MVDSTGWMLSTRPLTVALPSPLRLSASVKNTVPTAEPATPENTSQPSVCRRTRRSSPSRGRMNGSADRDQDHVLPQHEHVGRRTRR